MPAKRDPVCRKCVFSVRICSYCLAVAACFAGEMSIVAAEYTAREFVEALSKAKTGEAVRRIYEDNLCAAGSETIEELRMVKHNGVAISATWESVRRGIQFRRESGVSTPSRASIAGFLGFVEGRARCPAPKAWSESVYSAKAHQGGRTEISVDSMARAFEKSSAGVYVQRGWKIDTQDGAIEIDGAGSSFRLPSEIAKKCRRYGPIDSISIGVSEKRVFVATPSCVADPFMIIAISKEERSIE